MREVGVSIGLAGLSVSNASSGRVLNAAALLAGVSGLGLSIQGKKNAKKQGQHLQTSGSCNLCLSSCKHRVYVARRSRSTSILPKPWHELLDSHVCWVLLWFCSLN